MSASLSGSVPDSDAPCATVMSSEAAGWLLLPKEAPSGKVQVTVLENGQLRALRHEAGLLERIEVGDSLPAFIGPFQQIEGLAAEGRLDGGIGSSAHHLHDKRALAQRVAQQGVTVQQGGVGLRVPVVEDAARDDKGVAIDAV